jgi:hypothetical protein
MGSRLKVLLAAFVFGLLAMPAWAQNSAPTLNDAISGYESAAHQSFQGLATDWSSHHVLYSKPEPGSDAEYQVQQDPSYWEQQIRRSSVADGVQADTASQPDRKAKKNKKKKKIPLARDWNVPLGIGGNLAAGNFPAKFSFSNTASCTDFVVYPTGLLGATGGQANIVAYSNLYAGTCSAPVPSAFWAYNTGTGDKVTTSPALSNDGKQVAFVQTTTTGTAAALVLLKWSSTVSVGTLTGATAPTSVALGSYRACTAPCMTVIGFNGAPSGTNSSPFYDQANDVIYVGDAGGKLHKFSGVFLGTPAEVVSGFPETLGTTALTSPIFDNGTSQKVFVTDAGGFLYSVPAAGGSKITSGQIGFGTPGTVDGPIIDPSTEKVYVFVGNDGAGSGGVFQFAAAFTGGTFGIEEVLGSAATGTLIYDGTFDNKYFTGAGITGNIYVCGYHTGGTAPRVFQIVMNAGFTGTVNTFDTPSGGAATCSPVTEFCNPGTAGTCATVPTGTAVDWIFLSMTANGTGTGCAGACIYNYNVNSGAATGTSNAGLAAAGGTSGISIDNASTVAGASQVYYSALANKATTTTTASALITATTIHVTSGAGIANNDYLIIGSEILKVTAGGGTVNLTVTRAQLGTTAAAIANTAAVTDNGAAVQASQAGLI